MNDWPTDKEFDAAIKELGYLPGVGLTPHQKRALAARVMWMQYYGKKVTFRDVMVAAECSNLPGYPDEATAGHVADMVNAELERLAHQFQQRMLL